MIVANVYSVYEGVYQLSSKLKIIYVSLNYQLDERFKIFLCKSPSTFDC